MDKNLRFHFFLFSSRNFILCAETLYFSDTAKNLHESVIFNIFFINGIICRSKTTLIVLWLFWSVILMSGIYLNWTQKRGYLLKVNNRISRTRCEICSKLTIKTLEVSFYIWNFVNDDEYIVWISTQTHIRNTDSYSDTDSENLHISLRNQLFSLNVIEVSQWVAKLLTEKQVSKSPLFADNLGRFSDRTTSLIKLPKYQSL